MLPAVPPLSKRSDLRVCDRCRFCRRTDQPILLQHTRQRGATLTGPDPEKSFPFGSRRAVRFIGTADDACRGCQHHAAGSRRQYRKTTTSSTCRRPIAMTINVTAAPDAKLSLDGHDYAVPSLGNDAPIGDDHSHRKTGQPLRPTAVWTARHMAMQQGDVVLKYAGGLNLDKINLIE